MPEAPEHKTEDEIKIQLAFLLAAEERARKRARIIGVLVFVVLAFGLGAFVWYAYQDPAPAEPGKVYGGLSLAGTALGSAEVNLDTGGCLSGFANKFRGVDIRGADGWQVRAVEDRLEGSWVRVERGDQGFTVRRGDCDTFELKLTSFEGRTKGGLGYGGSLKLACRVGSGRLQGDLRFVECPD